VNSNGHHSVWIGYDSREVSAFAVARYSIRRFNRHIPIRGVVLSALQKRGLYTRPTSFRKNGNGHPEIIDVLSKRQGYDGRVSTEFAVSRYLVPHLAKTGWALFVDSDILCFANISRLFALCMPDKAAMCVKHDHRPQQTTKMDGQKQTSYRRKNWTSVIAWNCDHPANRRLTLEMINRVPSLELHSLSWLEDDEIGALPYEWNYLVGEPVPRLPMTPNLVHFTNGLPDMPGYENQEFAEEWRRLQPYAVGAL
jgi:hypothetical protein